MERRFLPVRLPYIVVILVAGSLLIASTGIFRVAPREIAVRRGPGGPRVVEPGFHYRIPFLHEISRYPAGPVELRAEANLVSPEGASLRLPYEATVRFPRETLPRLDVSRDSTDLMVFIRERIRAGLQESVSRLLPGEGKADLLARDPGAELTDYLEVEGIRLDKFGFQTRAMSRPGAAPDPPAWIGKTRTDGPKILLLGIDGADWQILRPLLDRGELPVIGKLVDEGSWADLKSNPPILSPLLWTTVATGRSPEEHGIVDFLVRDPERRAKLPISSRYRKVKALWNLFSEADRSVDVVAWWATWPAETIRGRMVTDRVAYSLFGYQASESDRTGATHPPELLDEIEPLMVDPDQISYQEIHRFIDITAAEYRSARAEVAEDPRKGYRNPINHLARILASTRTYASVTRELLRRGQADLLAVYFQGIDEVCHRFAHYMPPKMDLVSEADFRKFRSAVEEFYRYQDEVLGEIVAAVEPGTAILVLSDHGFLNGPDRPVDTPADIEGKPAKWHRLYGIWILHGPMVRPGPTEWVSLFDAAPTILYLAGLPISEEMPGRPILEALREDFRQAREVMTVPTFEGFGRPEPVRPMSQSAIDAEMLEKLRSLGYIGPAADEDAREEDRQDDTQETVTYHTNLGSVYLQKGDYERAEQELRSALGLYSRYTPALQMLIQIQVHQERWDEALELSRRVLDSGGDFELNLFHQLARIYKGKGDLEDGLDHLRSLEDRFPASSQIPAAIGVLELERGNPAAAESRFREALEIDPADIEAMTRLFQLLKERGEIPPLRRLLEEALEKSPRSVMHRNWMGLVRLAAGDPSGAEEEYRRALETDPDFPGTLANLGALYGRTGRLEEAEPILRRAVQGHPNNIEARVNLGAVLGKLGRPEEAAECLEGAIGLGYRTAELYNAIGRARFESGNLPGAIDALKESLTLDPEQPEIRRILRELREQH